MLIELKGLTKLFRTEEVQTAAVSDLDLQIQRGDFVAIMGPSGCGKSSLLNILGMLDSSTSGSYIFDGEDISNYSEDQLSTIRKKNIGFVFQSFNLIDELTIRENIELPLLYQKLPASEITCRVNAVLEKLNISHRANHRPYQLSGGQQQRVAVARALVIDPQVILADEPTGNLDTKHGEEVMEMLRQLHEKGTTIVMVTHSEEHTRFANYVVNLLDGKVVSEKRLEKQTETTPEVTVA
ncbi:ABC transporter ATP-binding protein [Paraneptunicella aestuarii]|uniref:ABC transporter ATP-binding protein n=1 Tax=Paraneptunicella aestuarii TaxID=2831148 RepID=UPI001E311783|nr:ABC transporter ATP-binding protein [Paraneptunicella aestuarii]UAA37219.1 ABC transporter ATP-binding protein [Paraneptunicella aestuarii]